MPQLALVSPFSVSAEALRTPDVLSRARCQAAESEEELALHRRIRHEVFVVEQGLFAESDHDEHDERADTVHALGLYGAIVAGTVRFYPLAEPGLWKGDRLAVLPQFRSHGLGGPLVRFAVRTAGQRGGERMIAFIQPQNVPVFEHLGWRRVGLLVDYVRQPHQKMIIDLTTEGEIGASSRTAPHGS
jgi:putative N-acetyltransferase (TIGR04045 family)